MTRSVRWYLAAVRAVTAEGVEIHEPISEWLDWAGVERELRPYLAAGYRNVKPVPSNGNCAALPNLGVRLI